MMHTTRHKLKCAAACLLSAMFTAGVLLAGSDGAWFPWINFAGACLLAALGLIGLLLSR